MTPEREAELFLKIDMLIEICRSLQSDGGIKGQGKVLQLALAGRHTRKSAA